MWFMDTWRTLFLEKIGTDLMTGSAQSTEWECIFPLIKTVISYDEIIEERKKDAKANMEYFYQQLMAIPAIKEMFEDDINEVD